MFLELYERRTTQRLITHTDVLNNGEYEENCTFCLAKDSVKPTGTWLANANGLVDAKGNPMIDQYVVCTQCGKKWVDVFRRITQ